MTRARWWGALATYLLCGCDDGVLRAFEPRPLALGGVGGAAPSAGGDGGRSGAATEGPAGAGVGTASTPLLLDDFEDGDMHAKEPRGWWYPVNDGTGTQGTGIEPVSAAPTSVYALRTHGSGFSDWGAAVGVNLIGDSTPFDARAYGQLCFTARVEATSSSAVQVHLLRDPGVHFERGVTLSESWARYCLPLAEFTAADRTTFVADQLIALQFFFAPNARFELWLDDVEVEP